MATDDLLSESNDAATEDVNEIFKSFYPYIVKLVQRKIPRNFVSVAVLDLEIDEIVQRTLIKFWYARQRGSILYPQAYIRRIVRTEIIDFTRKHKRHSFLSLNEECDADEQAFFVSTSSDLIDEFEKEEVFTSCTTRVAREILALPPRQRQAILCALRDRFDDVLPAVEIFMRYGLDIEQANWSTDRAEIQRLRASLCIARKKLRLLRKGHLLVS